VVLDVAFAAEHNFEKRTLPFIRALGKELLCWIDHHEHRRMWPAYAHDPRFVLVPNRVARACPELVTPQVVEEAQRNLAAEYVVAHADFDGALSAIKWISGGKEAWPDADEDARAVDSPGRGNVLSDHGDFCARAIEMAGASYDRPRYFDFLTEWVNGVVSGQLPERMERAMEKLAEEKAALDAEVLEVVDRLGSAEGPDIYTIRAERPQANHRRRQLLLEAERRARVGVVIEPDPRGGILFTAATFDESLDLEDIDGLMGGRSDYRFCRMQGDGRDMLNAIAEHLESVGP
jgi:uncharacterized protein (UPF0335 family)